MHCRPSESLESLLFEISSKCDELECLHAEMKSYKVRISKVCILAQKSAHGCRQVPKRPQAHGSSNYESYNIMHLTNWIWMLPTPEWYPKNLLRKRWTVQEWGIWGYNSSKSISLQSTGQPAETLKGLQIPPQSFWGCYFGHHCFFVFHFRDNHLSNFR